MWEEGAFLFFMNITKQTIEYMAHLARLPITADDGMCADIRRIMDYMNTVPTASAKDVPPALHSVLREDEVGKTLSADALDLAAFTVPKAVE